MDIQKACDTLEFISLAQVNKDSLKKRYRKMALKHHPDRGGDPELFKKAKEAYECLGELVEDVEDTTDTSYASFIKEFFLDNIFGKDGLGKPAASQQQIFQIVKDIVQGVKKVSMQLLENLDRESALFLYDFLSKHRETIHIPKEVVDNLRQILVEKYEDLDIFVIHPSLEDLFNKNIYKWEHKGETFIIPLWHHELVFENRLGGEIIVKCLPDLPDLIRIDEENNIWVECRVPWTPSLFQEKEIVFSLGGRDFAIPVSSLFIKREQMVVMKKKGISRVGSGDGNMWIHGVEEKGDIYVHVFLDVE